MEATDTIYKVSDSISVVTHHIASESNDLTGYMEDLSVSPHDSIAYIADNWGVLANLGAISALIGAITVAIFMFLLVKSSDEGKEKIQNVLSSKLLFGAVWLAGFIVYDVGMCTGNYISLLTNAPLAIIYAFKIFIFDSDVSEIHGVFHESWLYSLGFAIVHFAASVVTTAFLIRLFGFNMLSRFRLWQAGRSKAKSVSDTYVFWGLNEAAFHLIESIRDHYKRLNSEDYRIVVIGMCNDDTETSEKKIGIDRIFDFLSMTSKDRRRLQGQDCLMVGKFINFSDITLKDSDNDIIVSVLKLKSLKNVLLDHTTKRIHMLFLSDNEKANLHDTSILLNDTTINSFINDDIAGKHHQVLFYCHARYNSIHRIIEDQHSNGKIRVNVVDSSHISVQMLKTDKKLLPVKFVKVESDATVSTAFDSLVVGFSEVGRDAVRFLYEFGAFVKTHSQDGRIERSDFNLNVVDRDMDTLAGPFVAGVPAINISMPFLKKCDCAKDSTFSSESSETNTHITFHKMDCCSVEFYLRLDEWVKTLNYVVIATDDDELNLSLGVRVFKAAIRHRDDISNLCILVRTHNDDDGHFQRVATHYNRLWLAQTYAPEFDGKNHKQTVIEHNSPAPSPIHIFGLDNETYTYENIIDDSNEKEAADFKELYEASTKQGYVKPADYMEYSWNKDIAERLNPQDKDGKINYAPTYSGMMALRRMQQQDIANSMHKFTKSYLADKALAAAGLSNVDWSSLIRKHQKVTYTLQSGNVVNHLVVRILTTLAQTEHLRWNASHELLGYVQEGNPPEKDEASFKHEGRMCHSCIVDWDRLSPETQSHDYNVVDVTLDIINPKRPQKI